MKDLLETDDLFADDNFFEMGGDSVMALSLITRIESECDVRISLIEIIRNPTANGIADAIGRPS